MEKNPAISILQRERDQLAEQVKGLRSQMRAIDAAIQQLSGNDPEAVRTSRLSGPTLAKRVVDVLHDSPDGMTPQEIAEKLTENGRQTGNTTVSSILSRLSKAGKAKKYDKRWYVEKEEQFSDSSNVGQPSEDAGALNGPQRPIPPMPSVPAIASGLLAGRPLVNPPPLIPHPGKKGG